MTLFNIILRWKENLKFYCFFCFQAIEFGFWETLRVIETVRLDGYGDHEMRSSSSVPYGAVCLGVKWWSLAE